MTMPSMAISIARMSFQIVEKQGATGLKPGEKARASRTNDMHPIGINVREVIAAAHIKKL